MKYRRHLCYISFTAHVAVIKLNWKNNFLTVEFIHHKSSLSQAAVRILFYLKGVYNCIWTLNHHHRNVLLVSSLQYALCLDLIEKYGTEYMSYMQTELVLIHMYIYNISVYHYMWYIIVYQKRWHYSQNCVGVIIYLWIVFQCGVNPDSILITNFVG